MSHALDCTTVRDTLPELVASGSAAAGEVAGHLAGCATCAAEYQEVRTVWERLPEPAAIEPPIHVRRRVLAYARAATRPLSLAALLRGTTPRAVRGVFAGTLGALGAFVALSIAIPVGAAFEFCRLAVFGGAALSLGEACAIHLVLAALYAGLPLGVATYWWLGNATWAAGLAEAVVFIVLAAPVLLLQAGLDQPMITGVMLLGLAVGALGGGFAGTALSRRRPHMRAR